MNKNKTKSNKIAARLTGKWGQKDLNMIRELVGKQFVNARVKFYGMTEGYNVPLSEADTVSVYIQQGAVYVRGSSVRGLRHIADVLR